MQIYIYYSFESSINRSDYGKNHSKLQIPTIFPLNYGHSGLVEANRQPDVSRVHQTLRFPYIGHEIYCPSPTGNTKVLCPPKVFSASGPTIGLGCCVHGPQMEVAENIRASFGSQPVQPEVIIQYRPSCLKMAGASLCPPGKIRIYRPVCPW